jgi:hypothetical protein
MALGGLPLAKAGKPFACIEGVNCCTPGFDNCWGSCQGDTLPGTLYADLPAIANNATNSFSTAGGVFVCTKFDQHYYGNALNIPHFNLPTNDAGTYPGAYVNYAIPNCFYMSGVLGTECGLPVRAVIVLNGIDAAPFGVAGYFYAGYIIVTIRSVEVSPGVFEDRYDFESLNANLYVPHVWFPDYPTGSEPLPAPAYDNEAVDIGDTVDIGGGVLILADCFDWSTEWEWYGQTYNAVIDGSGATALCLGGPDEDFTINATAQTIRVSTS